MHAHLCLTDMLSTEIFPTVHKHFVNAGLKGITQCILQVYSKARVGGFFAPCYFMLAHSYLFLTISNKNNFYKIIS